jgi:hypothetical protein
MLTLFCVWILNRLHNPNVMVQLAYAALDLIWTLCIRPDGTAEDRSPTANQQLGILRAALEYPKSA